MRLRREFERARLAVLAHFDVVCGPLPCDRGRRRNRACRHILYSREPRVLCYDSDVTSAVRKAIFPVAGLGTRFLPATKAQPKEMLPLVDKPIIQYGVVEAVASGID